MVTKDLADLFLASHAERSQVFFFFFMNNFVIVPLFVRLLLLHICKVFFNNTFAVKFFVGINCVNLTGNATNN